MSKSRKQKPRIATRESFLNGPRGRVGQRACDVPPSAEQLAYEASVVQWGQALDAQDERLGVKGDGGLTDRQRRRAAAVCRATNIQPSEFNSYRPDDYLGYAKVAADMAAGALDEQPGRRDGDITHPLVAHPLTAAEVADHLDRAEINAPRGAKAWAAERDVKSYTRREWQDAGGTFPEKMPRGQPALFDSGSIIRAIASARAEDERALDQVAEIEQRKADAHAKKAAR